MRSAAGSTTERYAGRGRSFVDKPLVNGRRYTYTVIARDDAGNSTSRSVNVVPLALFNPPAGARVRQPPLLQWAAVPGATYYNLQVLHNHKVLSIWPTTNRFRMPRQWRFAGHAYKLDPGLYRWYVWPGIGPRYKAQYGPRVGGSFFTVVPK